MVTEERRAQIRASRRRRYIARAEEICRAEKARRDEHMKLYGADGRRLAEARKARGMFQREVAALLGVSVGCVSMWETGRMQYDPRRLDAVFGENWEAGA